MTTTKSGFAKLPFDIRSQLVRVAERHGIEFLFKTIKTVPLHEIKDALSGRVCMPITVTVLTAWTKEFVEVVEMK